MESHFQVTLLFLYSFIITQDHVQVGAERVMIGI